MLLIKKNSILSKSHTFSSIQELILWNSWLAPIKSTGTDFSDSTSNNPDTLLETSHPKRKEKRKYILHQAAIPQCPTFTGGQNQALLMRKAFLLVLAPAISSWQALVCHHLSLSPVPVAPTASQPPASILSQACQPWGGKAAFPQPPTPSSQNRDTQAGKAACAEVCRSIAAGEGEVESYANNHKGRKECSDLMDGCWCRRCSCSSGKRTPRATAHF